MSFTLNNFTVLRKGKSKKHGSITFTSTAATPTTGGTCTFSTNSHNVEGPFNYTLSGSSLTIDLSATNLVLSGNTQANVNYTSMSGTVSGLNPTDGSFTAGSGGMSSSNRDRRPHDDDTWNASATQGEDEEHHHHHKPHGHEAKA